MPLAGVQQQQWQWADAEAGYRQALESNPNDAAAHRGLAHRSLFQGRIDEALVGLAAHASSTHLETRLPAWGGSIPRPALRRSHPRVAEKLALRPTMHQPSG